MTDEIQQVFKDAEVYLNSRQAAELIKVGIQTLANWRFLGEGPPYCKTGRRLVVYKYTDLLGWLDQRRVVPEPKAVSND